ncbi:hypothetical protein B0T10DRAFT_198234 [Thelonectria olida]|uniref:Zn(2)-C6 fungal-type domain-containing protein n=1 Tax=Thelonectria olida TaxID=1576542 RepID=A0A9P8VTQ9_9HYPO|nr:hypothetical protein B0T10DRAFT_198234 [Thelonectria olida]
MKRLPPVGHPNGGRLGNRKERTGCVTCKKRKIKCDESKPFCHRCTSSRRECGGYAGPRGSHRAIVSPLPESKLATGLVANNQEHRAFRYFVNHRARGVAGPFGVDLWLHLIPQLSHTMPAVRHATMAIGALLLRDDELQSRGPSPESLALNEAHDVFAVEQYHKAIQSTLHALDEGQGSRLLAHTTCVLFFCIEALQGRENEALRLFKRALKAKLAPAQVNYSDTASDVESTFSGLTAQWAMFEDTVINDIAEAPNFDQPIKSISQAQSELLSVVTYAFDVWKTGFQLKWADSWNTTMYQAQQELELCQQSINDALDHWYTRFETYGEFFGRHVETPRHSTASSMLILWYTAITMWLAGSSVRSEMIYDSFLPRFGALITEATRILDGMEKQYEPVSFMFELGVIPPLYLAVLLCRHPVLRRKALRLLRQAPAQEGLWRRAIIVQACERIIELEEGSDGFIADIPEDLTQMIVPEEMRCRNVKIGVRTRKDGKWGNNVEFYSKPYGIDGAWNVYQEFFAA